MSVCDPALSSRPMLLAEERRGGLPCPDFLCWEQSPRAAYFLGWCHPLAVCRVLLCPLLCLGSELTDSNSICFTPTGVSFLPALAGSPVLQCRQCVPI